MKKFIYTISAIFLFSIAIFAQTDSENSIEWKLLAPETEEFSVDAPGNLMFSTFYNLDETAVYDKKENRRYSGFAGKTYFFILSDISAYEPQFKTTLKFVEINQPTELEKQKNLKAMNFKFSDDEKFFHTIYAVKTKNRSYIFHAVSESENDPNVSRFFKSLKVNGKPASVEFKEKLNIDKKSGVVIQETVKIVEENQNSEQTKRGLGAESGQGSGIGNGTVANPENIQRKALNITSKPKPKYTDFARFYEITGNVRMRTTFLKDGTIGATIPITKLPFGLTKSSIEAAKQMWFEPMTVKEQPVTVTKVVVFNFTIY